MINFILSFLWHSAIAQFGIAGLVLAGAIAVYIIVPPGPWQTPVHHAATGTALVCIIFLYLGPKLYLEGVNHERARFEAAEQKLRQQGDKARADALRDVTSGVRNDDPFDSDNH